MFPEDVSRALLLRLTSVLLVNSGAKCLKSVVCMYQADSKDGSQRAMKRKDTHTLDRELTKRVMA